MTASLSLREKQLDLTREAILEAFAAEVVEGGLDEVSFRSVAERAGVSLRTVFRHFPTREELIDGFNLYVHQRMGVSPHNTQGMALGDIMRLFFSRFDEHEQLMRALNSTLVGRDLARKGRADRVKMLERMIRPNTSHLPARDRQNALAICAHLFTRAAWMRFKDDFGLDGTQAGEAVAWAMETLLDDLKRRNQRAKERQR
jgi:AcrR family transcriptional regulator